MKTNLAAYILLSLMGLFFLFLLYIYTPQTVNTQKTIFLGIFILLCLMGIIAAIYPSHCMRIFKIETVTEYKCNNKVLKIEGHHPDCGNFKEHIFFFRNKKYCVGCTGLLIGSILAILTVLLYSGYNSSELTFWASGEGESVFWIGMFMVTFASLQLIFFNLKNKLVRFFSNLTLVWGSSLILVGLLEYRNIFLSIYFLFLVLTWIQTRTAVSQMNHEQICLSCQV